MVGGPAGVSSCVGVDDLESAMVPQSGLGPVRREPWFPNSASITAHEILPEGRVAVAIIPERFLPRKKSQTFYGRE